MRRRLEWDFCHLPRVSSSLYLWYICSLRQCPYQERGASSPFHRFSFACFNSLKKKCTQKLSCIHQDNFLTPNTETLATVFVLHFLPFSSSMFLCFISLYDLNIDSIQFEKKTTLHISALLIRWRRSKWKPSFFSDLAAEISILAQCPSQLEKSLSVVTILWRRGKVVEILIRPMTEDISKALSSSSLKFFNLHSALPFKFKNLKN